MTPHPNRTCPGCRQSFLPKYAFQQWCWRCWRERQTQEAAREEALENAFDRLYSQFSEACGEIGRLRREVERLTATNLRFANENLSLFLQLDSRRAGL